MATENVHMITFDKDLITVGSIVDLKGGGPAMTVKACAGDEVFVIWHNADGDLFKDVVPVCCLKLRG
jgi:uncharacterized protein YodC (DUF2158 family)